MKPTRFLFFIERELHLPMLAQMMRYINQNNLGPVGIASLDYQESTADFAGWGLRPQTVASQLGFEPEMVKNPYQWQADITFMADFSYHYTEGLGTIVNVGHGTISKGWFFSEQGISRRENCADLICVPGEIHKQMLESQVFIPIKVTGMPKLDRVNSFAPQQVEQLKTSWGLNPQAKTILFAPTFNKELSLIPHTGVELRRWIPSYYNIVIKLHGATDETIKKQFARYAAQTQGVYLCTEQDITPAFAVADILVSDVSSVIYEFISLGKPALLFDSPDQKSFPNHNPNNLEYRYRDVGLRFSHPQQLAELITRALTGDCPDVSAIAKQFVSVSNGTSTKMVIDTALQVHSQRKPRALMVLPDINPDFVATAKRLWGNRVELATIPFNNQLFTNLQQLASQHNYKTVIYAEPFASYSPLLPSLLMAHLVYHSQVKLAVPMLDKTNPPSLQELDRHFGSSNQQAIKVRALQLTYAAPGVAQPFKYPPVWQCFAVDTATLAATNFARPDEPAACWLDLLAQIERQQDTPALALDCLLHTGVQRPAYQQTANHSQQTQARQPMPQPEPQQTIQPKDELFARPTQSLQQLQDDLAQDPFNPAALKRLILHNYYNKAYDSIDVYVNLIPDDQEAALYLAAAHIRQDLLDEAEAVLSPINPATQQLQGELAALQAMIQLKRHNPTGADPLTKQALQLVPNSPRALDAAASLALFNGDVNAAASYLQQSIKQDPANPRTQKALEQVQRMMEQN